MPSPGCPPGACAPRGTPAGAVVRMALRIGAGVAAFGLAALLLPGPADSAHAGLALLANALACWRFGVTLLPGREPLITRYSRFDEGVIVQECRGYSRGLTVLWTGVLAGFAAACAAALAGAWPIDTVLATETLAGGALFLGEHVVRSLRFPHHGLATPLRTLRAVCLAHMDHHAA
mgnify:CR=1 FL=1